MDCEAYLSSFSPRQRLAMQNLPLKPSRYFDFRHEQLCAVPIVSSFVLHLLPDTGAEWFLGKCGGGSLWLGCRRRVRVGS